MQMKVAELKAELDLRKVAYDGLFEKEEFARRLADARAKGAADPKILDDFNKQAVERAWNADVASSSMNLDLESAAEAVASDGGLPGGMSPEKLQVSEGCKALFHTHGHPRTPHAYSPSLHRQALMSNPELVAMLSNPKMQDVMRKVMTEGPEAAAGDIADPEIKEMLAKVQSIMP